MNVQKSCWDVHHKHIDIPDWDTYFMQMAILAATRSHDAETQHGCIITKKNKVIGTGYNAFPSKTPEELYPNTRPHKYSWMVHAEINAIINCTEPPVDATLYVTGIPCLNCTKSIINSHIGCMVMLNRPTHQQKMDDTEAEIAKKMLKHANLNFYTIFIKESSLNRFNTIYKKCTTSNVECCTNTNCILNIADN